MGLVNRPKRSKEWIECECLRVLRNIRFFQTVTDVEIESHGDDRAHNWRLKDFAIYPDGRVTTSSHPNLFAEAVDAVRPVQEDVDLK